MISFFFLNDLDGAYVFKKKKKVATNVILFIEFFRVSKILKFDLEIT